MSEYLIFMDVAGDVAAEAQGLMFVPMEYSIGDEMRTCVGIEPRDIIHKFYDGQRHGDLTRTSQISPFAYEEIMEPHLAAGKSALYLCLSSGLSSTFQSAQMAQQSLKERYPDVDFLPLDTRGATAGMGLLAERALANREKGMSLEENFADLEAFKGKVNYWFMVQDLMYLKRGGRLSAATAVVGTMLSVKPILTINSEGKLDTIAKERGNKAAVKHLIKIFQEGYDPTSDGPIYIIDADIPELGDELESMVRALYPDVTIRRVALTPIIGAHTGPDMSAIVFTGKVDRK